MLTSGRRPALASRCPRNGPNGCCKFPLLRGPLSFHTLLPGGSHFLCFQRDVFQASCVGAPVTAACRGPAPAVIPGGKRAGRNVQDGGARRRPHPRFASSELGVEAKDGALGVSSRSSERASLALFIAQDPRRNLAGSSRHQKRSCLFGARTQAELLPPLFLPPPHLASDQTPSVQEPRAVSEARNAACEPCAVRRARNLKWGL